MAESTAGPYGESDSNLAFLSKREKVIQEPWATHYRRELKMMNVGRFAGGGTAGGRFTVADLRALLARPEDVTTIADVNRLLRERNHEEGDLAKALKHLHDVRKDSESTDKELADAEERVTKARDDARKSTDDYRAALDELKATAQAYVSQVQDLGSAFGGEATSLTAQGLLAKKKSVASDAAEFRVDLGIIRRKGADRDLLAELKGEGPTSSGLALIRDLIRQPRSYFKAEARADNKLDRNARSLGTSRALPAGGLDDDDFLGYGAMDAKIDILDSAIAALRP